MDEHAIHRACRSLEAEARSRGHDVREIDCWLRGGYASVHVWFRNVPLARSLDQQFDAETASDALTAAEAYIGSLPGQEIAA